MSQEISFLSGESFSSEDGIIVVNALYASKYPTKDTTKENKKQISSLIKDLFSCSTSESTSLEEHHIVFERLKKIKKSSKLKLLETEKTDQGMKSVKKIHFDEQGVGSWAAQLNKHEGELWDEIRQIPNTLLVEQLVELYLLAEKNLSKDKPEQTKKWVRFAIHMAQLATDSELNDISHVSPELLVEAHEVIGQLIYLIDHQPKFMMDSKQKIDYHELVKAVQTAFADDIKGSYKILMQHYQAHNKTQLQSADIAYHTLLPRELSRLLITERGTVNMGIIDPLLDIFLDGKKPLLNYEESLYYALQNFKHMESLRGQIEKVKAPLSNKTTSIDVLRATLGLEPDAAVSDLDAKRAILQSMISHVRQGALGSCFAISLLIKLLSSDPKQCLNDLEQIVEKGKLIRTSKGVTTEIPFINRIADENMDRQIEVDAKGFIIRDKKTCAHLSEAPGLIAACNVLGVKDVKALVNLIAVEEAQLSKGGGSNLTIGQWIEKICEKTIVTTSDKSLSLSDLYTKAAMAFSGQVSQPLLMVWENAIAGMAEVQEKGALKQAITTSVMHALLVKLQHLGVPKSSEVKTFFGQIQQALNKKIILKYDPTLGNDPTNERPNAKEGGFVLYSQDQRIDNYKDFLRFLKSIVAEVHTHIIESKQKKKEEIDPLYELCNLHIPTEAFMDEVLRKYYECKGLIVDLSQDYDKMPFTPWESQGGNSSKRVLEVYLESDKELTSVTIAPENASALLKNILDLNKGLSREEEVLLKNNPHIRAPVRIVNCHSFSFLPGHPTLMQARKGKATTDEWIQDQVIGPGQLVANSRLSTKSRDSIVNQALEKVLPRYMKKSEILSIAKEIQKKGNVNEKVYEFRNRLLAVCHSLKKDVNGKGIELANDIDSLLYDCLEPKLKEQLANSAVVIADTNWCEGIHDIVMTLMVNPGTGKLELCKMTDDKKHFFALDQGAWLNKKKWEFFDLSMSKPIVGQEATS